MTILDCGGKSLDLSQPRVMGILNITPDSFSDGGDFILPAAALERARSMVDDGVDIIDIGGESTRPGSQAVSTEEELERVIPIVSAVAAELPVPISIDTCKAEVMREAVAAGAGMINDVMALQADGALVAALDVGVPVCLMHMQGEPRSMQQEPAYGDVVAEVQRFFQKRVAACEAVGIPRESLLLDPGFGFGKLLEHNLELLRHLDRFAELDLPLLVGVSRKSMLGAILDNAPVDERLYAGLAAAVMAVERGAAIIRTHDVKPTVDALKTVQAVTTVVRK